MKIPKRLQPLLEDGLIDSVVRQLMSGKEAMVFVVVCGDDIRCAKVYKEVRACSRYFRACVAARKRWMQGALRRQGPSLAKRRNAADALSRSNP